MHTVQSDVFSQRSLHHLVIQGSYLIASVDNSQSLVLLDSTTYVRVHDIGCTRMHDIGHTPTLDDDVSRGAGISVAFHALDVMFWTHKNLDCLHKFDVKTPILEKFGSRGKLDGQFKNPQGVTLTPSKLVAVADTGNSRVQIFTMEGLFVRKFGISRMSMPCDIVATRDNMLYVMDRGRNCIWRYSQEGIYYGSIVGYFQIPYAIAIDHVSGHFFVSDSGSNTVEEFDRKDRHVQTLLAGEGRTPRGLACSFWGFLFVSDPLNECIVVLI